MLVLILGMFWNVLNRSGGVIVSVFTMIVVDRGFDHPTGQTKDYKINVRGIQK